jgi:hypothetical protein
MLFKRIDKLSSDAVSAGLDVFHLPATNITAAKAQWNQVMSLNPLTDPPFVFRIHGNSNFLDLNKTMLLTEMHIEKQVDAKWTPIEEKDSVSVVQAIGSTFIEDLKISLNNRVVYNSNRLQSYRTIIDMILSYGKNALDTHFQASGFYDEEKVNDLTDKGYLKRKNLFTKGKKAQFVSRIFSDLFMQDKYMLPMIDVDIEIMPRLSDNFLIQAPPNDNTTYRIVIDSARLMIKQIEVLDGLSLSFNAALAKTPAKYALKKSELKSMVITASRREFTANLFNDQIPRRLIIGLVPHNDFSGTTKNSPFRFVHGDVESIVVTANGVNYPNVPLFISYKDDLYTRPYIETMENLGFAFDNNSNALTLEKFKNGYCLYVINLTTNLEDENLFDLIRTGNTSITIRFNEPVPAGGYELIVFSENDGMLAIDSNFNISTDLTA